MTTVEDSAEGYQEILYSVADRVSEPLREPDPRRGSARLRVGGRSEVLGSAGAVLGRSRDCDIVLDDANVSRHLRQHGCLRRRRARQRAGEHDEQSDLPQHGALLGTPTPGPR